jgi:nicotinamidase-related amidase
LGYRPRVSETPTTPDADGTRSALVLIDLQNDWFADEELARCRDDLVASANRLIEAARAAGVPVLEVRTEHDPEGSTWTLSMQEDGQAVTVAGTPGAARVDDLAVADEVVLKRRDSAFFDTELAGRLDELGVGHVVLCGVSTESCISASAVDAFAHDLRVTLVEDATASIDRGLHRDTLGRLSEQYRQEVASTDEVVARWAR